MINATTQQSEMQIDNRMQQTTIIIITNIRKNAPKGMGIRLYSIFILTK